MMKLLLPLKILQRLRRELRDAGRREIGGLLMGEHVEGTTFRIVDMSVQRRGGSAGHFVRDPVAHDDFLRDFFERTGHAYERYNYLGEWHSHPSFEVLPSVVDIRAMERIIADPTCGVNFLVLLIVRLERWRTIELSATAFRAGDRPMPVSVEVEGAGKPANGMAACAKRLVCRWFNHSVSERRGS